MNVLLVYPAFPQSFYSFEETIKLVGRKAMLPPLALVTVAALLPQDWEFKLVDRNIRNVTEEEWTWADMVMFSAMIVQKHDLHEQIREAKRRGKYVVVGGAYPTALPHECENVGADFLVLDEGEITIPVFLDALARHETSGVFRSEGVKPDVTLTPIPRFDLLDLNAYSEMSVQFSRGCPFDCEFCDIIVLYGREPRTKTPSQILAELQCLYDLGWRRSIFMVDDNFIGNKKNVKLMLKELLPWMVEHDYPFSFSTEASVDLAQDEELMEMMVTCNFGAVFLGIETPDTESLALTKKTQNNREPLIESVERIAKCGLRVMAGFIIGFDNEQPGAGQRIVDFVERAAIPAVVFNMLQALPDTGLSRRLAQEGRLFKDRNGDIDQATLMNFQPTRPLAQIAREYIDALWQLYDPVRYLDRAYRHFMMLREGKFPKKPPSARKQCDRQNLNALLRITWRQGVLRRSRWRFWGHLYQMCRRNPGGVGSYLSVCAHFEHFHDYRKLVRAEIEAKMENHVKSPPALIPVDRVPADGDASRQNMAVERGHLDPTRNPGFCSNRDHADKTKEMSGTQ